MANDGHLAKQRRLPLLDLASKASRRLAPHFSTASQLSADDPWKGLGLSELGPGIVCAPYTYSRSEKQPTALLKLREQAASLQQSARHPWVGKRSILELLRPVWV